MDVEQEKTLNALRDAIQMEIEGKDFYLEASRLSGNELGRELLRTLAGEEDDHRQKFQEIYDGLRRRGGWRHTDLKPANAERVKQIQRLFTRNLNIPSQSQGETEAVKTAIGLEDKTYDYYRKRQDEAKLKAERDFYEMVAYEETRHKLVLLDYLEYLNDPSAWFVKKEHPTLDGA